MAQTCVPLSSTISGFGQALFGHVMDVLEREGVGALRLGGRIKAGWPGIRLVVASRGACLRGPLNRDAWGDGADTVDIVQLQCADHSSCAAPVKTWVVIPMNPIPLTRLDFLTYQVLS